MRRALVLLALLCGCGYRFGARSDSLPTEGKRVFAPTFQNDTADPGLEVVFTDAFRAELANAHAAGDSDCAVQAKGVVTASGGGPGLVYTNPTGNPQSLGPFGNTPAAYSVSASACVRLVETEKVLANACVNGTEDYAPGRDALEMEAARRVALQRLAKKLMREAFDKLSSGF